MEELDALARRGNACQDRRSHNKKLRKARRWEDEEDKKEAMRQQRFRKAKQKEGCTGSRCEGCKTPGGPG